MFHSIHESTQMFLKIYKSSNFDFWNYASSLKKYPIIVLGLHTFIILLSYFYIPFSEKKIPELMVCIDCFLYFYSHFLSHSTAIWAVYRYFSGFAFIVILAGYLWFSAIFSLPHCCVFSMFIHLLFFYPASKFWSDLDFNSIFFLYSFFLNCFHDKHGKINNNFNN